MKRDHPIRQLLDWLADGGTLSDDDLDELGLPATENREAIERAIRDSADTIAMHRRDGRRDLARRVIPGAVLQLDAMLSPGDPGDEPLDVPGLLAQIPRRN